MAKFLKSLFNPGDKKRSSKGDLNQEENDFTPPLDGRRKLSISRSGRMKQNNKKRASLNQDLFGEVCQYAIKIMKDEAQDDLHTPEKPTSKEYHVHGKAFSENIQQATCSKENVARVKTKIDIDISREATEIMTPEEEIEIAFKVIETNT